MYYRELGGGRDEDVAVRRVREVRRAVGGARDAPAAAAAAVAAAARGHSVVAQVEVESKV